MHNQDELMRFLYEKGETKTGQSNGYDLFCDIETFTTNRNAKKTSEQQSWTFTFAVSWLPKRGKHPKVAIFNNHVEFFQALEQWHVNPEMSLRLWYHNGNKYDNHFLESELAEHYNLPIYSERNDRANKDYNKNAKSESDFNEFDNYILESRVRSSNTVSLKIRLFGRTIETVDSLPKMNEPLRLVGKRLVNANLMEEKYLKTDFDYGKYDSNEKFTPEQAKAWGKRAFESLNDEQITYIENDVIILYYAVKHYSEIYYGFDISKKTFTQNIKDEYSKYSDLAKFQLLKIFGNKQHIKYGDYVMNGVNMFDYFRSFYKGGLNLYNDDYVGRLIKRKGFSIDLNSSYPTVMYMEKLPTYVRKVVDKPTTISPIMFNKDIMTFFVLTRENANKYVIDRIPSKVMRNAIVKYYNLKGGMCYYNSVMLELLNEQFGLNFEDIPVESYVTFDCEYFGARDVIARNYFIKTQGKVKNALTCTIDTIDPTNIEMTNNPKPKEYNYSDDMVQGAKVLLNGIYGVPALRAHFNIFKRDASGNIVNVEDGFENLERNIIFSAGVTAFAFRNLLRPFKYLTPQEIDEYFFYCDTDSLYLAIEAKDKFPSSMYHKMNLGGWDIEHEFNAFYPFNHKKYCLYDTNSNSIEVRCGGVSKDTIKQWIEHSKGDIQYFIDTYFHDGVTIQATRAIRNTGGTMSIYEAKATLEQGGMYMDSYEAWVEKEIEEIKKIVVKELENNDSGMLYVETAFGAIGANELTPSKKVENGIPAYYLPEDVHWLKNTFNES